MPLAVWRSSAGPETRIELHLRAELDEVTELAAELGRACAGMGEAGAELELAVVEAANNIVRHGLRGARDASFSAVIALGPAEISVEFEDRGPAIDPSLLDNPLPDDPLAESGRGFAIIRACTDAVEYRRHEGVNWLRLVKRRV